VNATHVPALVFSRFVVIRHPQASVIPLAIWGETLPTSLWRWDSRARDNYRSDVDRSPSETLKSHVMVTNIGSAWCDAPSGVPWRHGAIRR